MLGEGIVGKLNEGIAGTGGCEVLLVCLPIAAPTTMSAPHPPKNNTTAPTTIHGHTTRFRGSCGPLVHCLPSQYCDPGAPDGFGYQPGIGAVITRTLRLNSFPSEPRS